MENENENTENEATDKAEMTENDSSFGWVTNESDNFSNDGEDSTDTSNDSSNESDFGWIDKETPEGLTEIKEPEATELSNKELEKEDMPILSQEAGTSEEDEKPSPGKYLFQKYLANPVKSLVDKANKATDKIFGEDFEDKAEGVADVVREKLGLKTDPYGRKKAKEEREAKAKKEGEEIQDLFHKTGLVDKPDESTVSPLISGKFPKAEAEAPKTEAEAPKSEAPKSEAPKSEAPKSEAEAPKSEEAPIVDAKADAKANAKAETTDDERVPYYSGSVTDKIADTWSKFFMNTDTGKDVAEMNSLVKQYNENIGRGITDVANEVSKNMTEIANEISQDDSLNDVEKAREFFSAGVDSVIDTINGIVNGTQAGVGAKAGIQAIKVALSSLAFLLNWPIQLTTAGIKMFLQDHATDLEGFIPIKSTFDYIDAVEKQSDIRTSGRLTSRYDPNDTTSNAGQSYNKGLTKTYSDEEVKKFMRTAMNQPHIRKFVISMKK